MAKKSIGQLHADITANAASFVNEFNRADNVARRNGASIRKEATHILEHLERGFAGSKFAHGILSGFGLASGSQAIESIFHKFETLFHEPAEDAKKLGEYIDQLTEKTRALQETHFYDFTERLAPADKVATLTKHLDEISAKMNEVAEARAEAIGEMADFGGMNFLERSMIGIASLIPGLGVKGAKAAGDEAQTREQRAAEHLAALAEERERAEKARNAAREKMFADESAALGKATDDFLKTHAEAQKKFADAAEQLTKQLRNPEEKLSDSYDRAKELLDRGLITAETFDRATAAAGRQFDKETTPDIARFEKAGQLKVDDLTRRGLGSGADYTHVQQQQSAILGDIRDLLRRALAQGFIPGFGT